jgi:outer membrane immunogenic protein
MLKALFAAGALSALMVGGAAAADLIIDTPPMNDPVVSDWDGLYAGLTGAAWFEGTIYPAIGVELGGNFVSGNLLLGVEGDVAYYFTSGNLAGELSGRGGVLVTDDVLLYGSAGVGALSNGAVYFPFGVGVELMLQDSVSVDLQAEALAGGGGIFGSRISASLNYHF